jgi:hypothetical protein
MTYFRVFLLSHPAMKFNEQKRNLILLHENQTELLITFKHGGSEPKEKSRKIIDICWEEEEEEKEESN